MQTTNGKAPSTTETVALVDELPSALSRLGLGLTRPVLVSVGGASGLDAGVADRLLALFRDRLAPLLDQLGAAVVDGGTDAGVMALMGQARRAAGARFPLLGVAARGTVRLPCEPMGTGAALEPNHSHRLLVPGTSWGDEIPWMNAVATLLGADHASATLVAAGGRITRLDVDASLEHGRPTLLLAGSGGTADAIASAEASAEWPHRLIQLVPRDDDWGGLVAALTGLLVEGASVGCAAEGEVRPNEEHDVSGS